MTKQALLDKYPNYETYKNERQERFNALPIYWAFSDEQFEEVCEKVGAKGAEDFYTDGSLGGGFYLKKDAPIIHAYLEEPDPLNDLLKNYGWAKGAFIYEMRNHEYHINWQADYDVISCFCHIDYNKAEEEGYLPQTGWKPQTARAYKDAVREFYRLCDENDWW